MSEIMLQIDKKGEQQRAKLDFTLSFLKKNT